MLVWCRKCSRYVRGASGRRTSEPMSTCCGRRKKKERDEDHSKIGRKDKFLEVSFRGWKEGRRTSQGRNSED